MCVFNLDLNTVSEQLLVTSMAREFQTVGADRQVCKSSTAYAAYDWVDGYIMILRWFL